MQEPQCQMLTARLSLHLRLAAEGTSVLGLLADFNFLHHFLEGGTIADPMFLDSPNQLGVFSHVAVTEAQTQRAPRGGFKMRWV